MSFTCALVAIFKNRSTSENPDSCQFSLMRSATGKGSIADATLPPEAVTATDDAAVAVAVAVADNGSVIGQVPSPAATLPPSDELPRCHDDCDDDRGDGAAVGG